MYEINKNSVEESLNEIKKIRKTLSTSDTVSINFNKLDSITKERIRSSLATTLAEREAALFRQLNWGGGTNVRWCNEKRIGSY